MEEEKKIKKPTGEKNVVFLQKLKHLLTSKKLILLVGGMSLLLVSSVLQNSYKTSIPSTKQDQKTTEQKATASFMVNGKVLGVNQMPIEGAFVTIEGKSAVTNKDGGWEIQLISKPVSNITILAKGYERLSKAYAEDEALILAEVPKTFVTVNIADRENNPIPNAFVLYIDSNSYKPTMLQKTDSIGKVTFSNLPKDNGSFLVIMDGYKVGWGTVDIKNKDALTIQLEKPDQSPASISSATSSAQVENKEKNVDIYYDPSVKDKNKVSYSVLYKVNPKKLYEELKGIASFDSNKSLTNVSIFSSDNKQSLIFLDNINTLDKDKTGSQIVIFGNSLDNEKVESLIPLSVVLTKEYIVSITNKEDVIATILKLYESEKSSRGTTIVFKTENLKTDESVTSLHDESYLSYAVLSAKPEQKSDYYEYESRYCLENFDVPLYKPHARVVLDNRYYGDRDIYCEFYIERDPSEVIGEGKTKVVTNSIIGWYKNEMAANGWIVTPDKDTLQSIMSPRSEYIPAEFKKCKRRDEKTWLGIDLFVYEGIVPEPYGMFEDQLVFKLLMVERRLFSPSKSELEYYGCQMEVPTSTPTPIQTAVPFSVSANIPKEGCFDTDGGEAAGIQAGSSKGFDNPLVKGRVYVDGKDYTIIDGKKVINEDQCTGNGWLREYRCSKNYSGKLSWVVPYTSYCRGNNSCLDGACVQKPPEPTPKIITTGCSNSYGGMCVDCDAPPEGFISCQNSSITPFCPKKTTCTYFKHFEFNPKTFEWEFK